MLSRFIGTYFRVGRVSLDCESVVVVVAAVGACEVITLFIEINCHVPSEGIKIPVKMIGNL